MWYEYFQTDVDDKFHENENLCYHLLIEADSCEEANKKAQHLGVCFDEDYGYEFSCCRWNRCYYEIDFPSCWDNWLIFKEPEHYCKFIYERRRGVNGKSTKIHSKIYYRDGKRKNIG